MTKSVLLTTAAVLALSVGGVASAGTGKTPTASIHTQFGAQKHNIDPKKKKMKVLYNQNSDDADDAIDSQVFGSSYPSYSSQGADDFMLKKAGTVTEIDVTGQYYNGSGPASSETVTFYSDNGGVPGSVLQTFSKVKGKDSSGSFDINLGSGIALAASTTYWVSVQADLDFDSGGQWGWEVSSKQHGNQAEWQNPGGGFGVCQSWGTIESCVGSTGPDFMFELLGKK